MKTTKSNWFPKAILGLVIVAAGATLLLAGSPIKPPAADGVNGVWAAENGEKLLRLINRGQYVEIVALDPRVYHAGGGPDESKGKAKGIEEGKAEAKGIEEGKGKAKGHEDVADSEPVGGNQREKIVYRHGAPWVGASPLSFRVVWLEGDKILQYTLRPTGDEIWVYTFTTDDPPQRRRINILKKIAE